MVVGDGGTRHREKGPNKALLFYSTSLFLPHRIIKSIFYGMEKAFGAK
jgi:hypothetical protein